MNFNLDNPLKAQLNKNQLRQLNDTSCSRIETPTFKSWRDKFSFSRPQKRIYSYNVRWGLYPLDIYFSALANNYFKFPYIIRIVFDGMRSKHIIVFTKCPGCDRSGFSTDVTIPIDEDHETRLFLQEGTNLAWMLPKDKLFKSALHLLYKAIERFDNHLNTHSFNKKHVVGKEHGFPWKSWTDTSTSADWVANNTTSTTSYRVGAAQIQRQIEEYERRVRESELRAREMELDFNRMRLRTHRLYGLVDGAAGAGGGGGGHND